MIPKLGDFANEVLLAVFFHLTVRDVCACQLVCRRFNDIIRSSPALRFSIELSLAGYVESCNPRTDISTEEKCNALRLHRSRHGNHTVSSIDTIQMGFTDGGFRSWHLPSPTRTHPSLKDGVLAQWSLISPNIHADLQLDVVQLPSLNTGTGLKQWRLTQKGLNIKSYDFEPACDLLVLVEYTGPLVNNLDSRPPIRIDVNGLGGNGPQPYLFHFRTLSTNEPHPNAFQPVLDCGLRTGHANGFDVKCFGDLIIARPRYKADQWRDLGLLIYNWVTGALLDRRTEPYSSSLEVLTNTVIVIPRTTFAYNSRDNPIGRLDLYLIDWSDQSCPTLTFVAILELPVVHSMPPPPSYPPTVTLFGFDGPGQEFRPEHDLSAAAIFCRCEFLSSSQHGHPTSYTSGPSRMFASAPSSQLLRVHIQLPETESAIDFGGSGHGPSPRDTSFYVPLEVILDVVESATPEGAPRCIQWDQWGPRARWIHLTSDFWEQPLRAPTGTRCVLTRHSVPHLATIPFDPNVKYEFEILLLDFNPEFVKEVQRVTNRRSSEGEGGPGKWTYQPATNNHMSPIAPYVDQRRSWLAECSASKAVAPYVWSKLEHPYFEDVVAQLQHWTVMMDSEHIVVVEGAPVTGHMTEIVAFTF
ncbi:hypothetical protein FRC07_006808 [Ceratobasidium sp. 392]|nr:hypothetical protein FRC07_006808 [Ceratobasidium sp. 392]